ncbi:hypothetical protein [Neobacillus rhizophilus]|uniref:Uncharacterized protein n=1 Tax=Neobacillus rhizophilus TaxID=2833579 RepID=A0A942YYK7_9BACI|nr:hypothetical protein [Neobacillus rhizophilus]MBS4216240.1 hypothetical protein [Neobacillus rhizophilus]
MLGIAVTLVAAIIITAFEVPKMRKKKLTKELWTFLILMGMAVGLGIAESLHLNIPNPLNGIRMVLQPMSDVINGLLK